MPGGQELWIVVVLAVLLFGGTQIPKLAKSLGQAKKEFKKGLDEGEEEGGDEKSNEA